MDITVDAAESVAISGASLADLAARIRRTRRPMVLTRDGVGELVVLPIQEYERLQEAMEVAAALLQGNADVAAGRVVSNEEAQQLLQASIEAAARLATGARRPR